MRNDYEIVFEIPFNSLRKWHLVIGRKVQNLEKDENSECEFILMMKGAPEVLIKLCSKYRSESGFEKIDDEFNLDFQDAYLHFGKEGQ